MKFPTPLGGLGACPAFRLVAKAVSSLTLLFAVSSTALAGSVKYEFTGGSLAPTVTNLPTGVTADNLVLGAKFQAATGVSGNLFDDDGGPDSLRITGADGTPQTTGEAFTAGTTLNFTIHIPAGTTCSLQSLTIDYKGTAIAGRSNARLYSSILGHGNATAHTIGVLGRETGGTDAAFVVDTIDLVTPRSNATVGASVQNGDFTNLTNRSVTFEIPWMDAATAATAFIDIDNITLNFVDLTPPVVSSLKVTDFQIFPDRSTQITFTGVPEALYSVMASTDLTGPLYRKRWTPIATGIFGEDSVIIPDGDSITMPKRFYVVSASDVPTARIMAVGDSITEGGSTFFVYRGRLFDKLKTAGYRFTFVGPKASNYASPVTGTTVSLQHEGEGGANATKVASNFASSFPSYPADLVLIHAGHNYDLATQTESAIIAAVENATRSMITTARTVNPKVKILLAQVITSTKVSDVNPSVVKYAYIPALNNRLAQVAAELSTEMAPIYIVNQAEGWNTPTDAINDKVHPTDVGAEKMAVKWFNTLVPLLE